MNEWVGRWPGTLVSAEADLDREFEERLRDSSGLAFSIVYGVLRNREDAQEVAQEAFARAFRRFRQLKDRQRFRAWLTRMTWRLAIDRWRADRRRALREQAAADHRWQSSTEEVAAARERSQHVWRAIDDLPDKLRIVIVLSAIEGHDTGEVARLLDVPDGTVKSRLFLARIRISSRSSGPRSNSRDPGRRGSGGLPCPRSRSPFLRSRSSRSSGRRVMRSGARIDRQRWPCAPRPT